MHEFFPSPKFSKALAKLTADSVIIAVSSGEHCQRPTPEALGTNIDIYSIKEQYAPRSMCRYVTTISFHSKSKIWNRGA